jgi:thiamine-phosphate pyrophosphorylase
MKLVIMTKPTFFVEEDKILATLFEGGMESLHLYKPGAEPVYTERLLTLLPENYRNRITVHEHFYLKDEFRLRGIHLDDPSSPLPLGYKGSVGRTCCRLDELKDMKRRSNYVFLKADLDSLQANLQRGLIDKRVYAFGGITLDYVRVARELGFGGVVVCEDLWNRFNIHHEKDYKELLAHFDKLRKAAG